MFPPPSLFTGFERPRRCCVKAPFVNPVVRGTCSTRSIFLCGQPAPAGSVQISSLWKMRSICSVHGPDTQQTGSRTLFVFFLRAVFCFILELLRGGSLFYCPCLGWNFWPLGAGCFSYSFCTSGLIIYVEVDAGRGAGKLCYMYRQVGLNWCFSV